ncbi:hypothetical protein BDZ91DRAFT_766524 [Kalaharituber pfeilii]|nr:hypothetical protein BDZ91DRAFT_766524 [Kalaharituber pfeilii]
MSLTQAIIHTVISDCPLGVFTLPDSSQGISPAARPFSGFSALKAYGFGWRSASVEMVNVVDNTRYHNGLPSRECIYHRHFGQHGVINGQMTAFKIYTCPDSIYARFHDQPATKNRDLEFLLFSKPTPYCKRWSQPSPAVLEEQGSRYLRAALPTAHTYDVTKNERKEGSNCPIYSKLVQRRLFERWLSVASHAMEIMGLSTPLTNVNHVFKWYFTAPS